MQCSLSVAEWVIFHANIHVRAHHFIAQPCKRAHLDIVYRKNQNADKVVQVLPCAPSEGLTTKQQIARLSQLCLKVQLYVHIATYSYPTLNHMPLPLPQ